VDTSVVAYVKKPVKSELSIYQIMQILSIFAFDKTPLSQLLNDFQNNQNVKEQLYNFLIIKLIFLTQQHYF
jgi:hypothetical protein